MGEGSWIGLGALVAALVVVSVTSCLILNHRVTSIYADSIRVSRNWSDRVTRYVELRGRASAVAEPIQEMAQSQSPDPADATRRMIIAKADFDAAVRLARAEMNDTRLTAFAPLLDRIEQHMNAASMAGQAKIAALADHNLGASTLQGAAVDDELAGLNRDVTEITTRARALQNAEMETQLGRVRGFAFWQNTLYWLVGPALLVALAGAGLQARVLYRTIRVREQSEQTLRLRMVAVEAAQDAIVITDAAGRIEYVNPAFTRCTGYEAAEVVGKMPSVLRSGRHDAAFYSELWQTITTGNVWQGEMVNRRKDGSLYNEEMSITPVRDAGGAIIRFIAIKRDVTVQRKSEAQRNWLATFPELNPCPVAEVDIDGRIHFLNPAAKQLLRGSERHPMDHPWFQDWAPVVQALTDGQTNVVRDVLVGDRWYQQMIYAAAVSKTIRVYAVDITERVRNDEAMRRTQGELEATAISLRGQTRLLRSILDHIPQNVFWKNRDSVYLGCGAKFAGLAGLKSPQDIVGKSDYDMPWGHTDADTYRAGDRKVIESGQASLHVEETQLTADGSQIYIQTNKVPLHDADGRVVGVLGIYEDVTERKHAEDALRRDETRQRALLELSQKAELSADDVSRYAMESGIQLTGSKIGYIAFMNEDESVLTMRYWSKTAMDQCAILNKPIVYPVKDTGLWGEAVRRRAPVITNDYAAPNLAKKGTPHGHVKLVRHVSIPVFDNGRIVAVAGVGNKETDYTPGDVTQLTLMMDGMWSIIRRKEAEAALAQSEAQHRLLLDSTAEAIVGVDAEGRLTFCNPASLRLLGYERAEDLLGKSFHNLAHHTDADGHAIPEESCRLLQALHVGKGVHVDDGIFWRADGTSFPVEVWSHPQAESGQVVGAVVTFLDITDRKRNEAMEHERTALSQAVNAMEHVIGIVAHELRTPLAGLRAISELLLDHDLRQTSDFEGFLTSINQETIRMADTVNGLLEAARINSGRATWDWGDVDLNAVGQGAIATVDPLVDSSQVVLELQVTPPDARMRGDANAISRLLVNLLGNARKHTAHGHIRLRINRISDLGNQWAEISVGDSGEGISPAIAHKLGEAFALNSGVVGANHVKGTGLGLAICKAIVAAHGGTIRVHSTVDAGTTVTVRLQAALPGPAQERVHVDFIDGRNPANTGVTK